MIENEPEHVVWTSVFAAGPGGGNPCPVVFGAQDWSAERLQERAASYGAETAFVLPPQQGGDARLRYFVPRHEMEMCVHATVGATVVLGRTGHLTRSPATIETPLGPLAVEWDESSATVAQFPPVFGPALTAAQRGPLLAALGVGDDQLDDDAGPIRSVSTARPKLMIALRDEAVLDGLTPDFERLWTVCDDLEVTGVYAFTPRAEGAQLAARQFPVRAGYVEDPATGVAACALGAQLAERGGRPGWNRWLIAQGRALGRPSLITAEAFVEAGAVTAVRVGGEMIETAPDDRPL